MILHDGRGYVYSIINKPDPNPDSDLEKTGFWFCEPQRKTGPCNSVENKDGNM